jgi:hypothetical protein
MMSDQYSALKEQLDKAYAWPVVYTFKFIVPSLQEHLLRNLFPMHSISERSSKEGKYTAFTIQMMMPSSEAVIDIYKKVSFIEGIISL